MLNHLNWLTLEQRRNQAKFHMFYEIITNINYHFSVPHDHLTQSSPTTPIVTAVWDSYIRRSVQLAAIRLIKLTLFLPVDHQTMELLTWRNYNFEQKTLIGLTESFLDARMLYFEFCVANIKKFTSCKHWLLKWLSVQTSCVARLFTIYKRISSLICG